MQDVDSQCEVTVNGEALQKGVRTRIKPGAVLHCGQDLAAYQVGPAVVGRGGPRHSY